MSGLVTARDKALGLLEHLKERGPVSAVPTGIDVLDETLGGGFRPSLIMLGGVAGVGKTAFALQTSLRVGRTGMPVLYFTAEQTADELLLRLLAHEIKRPVVALHDGESGAIAAAFEALDRLPLDATYVEEDRRGGAGSVAKLTGLVTATADRHGCAPFVVVDYLQKLGGEPGAGSEDLRVSISRVSNGIASLTREHGLTLLAVSSLNRAAYKSDPSLDAFKETGSIEFDADLAMILRRPVAEAGSAGPTTPIEVWIVKHRQGVCPITPLMLRFDGALGSFVSGETLS